MSISPSDSEMAVLKCFWRDGELSAREVHDRVGSEEDWNLSTTRTIIERMRKKGLVKRRSLHGVAVFTAARSKVDILGAMTRRVSRLFEIDGGLPAAAFSGSQILSEKDIAALDALLKATIAKRNDDDSC